MKRRKTSAEDLKWFTDMAYGVAGELGADIKDFSEHHFRIYIAGKQIDFWPSSQKAMIVDSGRKAEIVGCELREFILRKIPALKTTV